MTVLTAHRQARRHRLDRKACHAASRLLDALFAAEASALELLSLLRGIAEDGCEPTCFPMDDDDRNSDFVKYLFEQIKNVQVNANTGRSIIGSHIQPVFDPTRWQAYTQDGKVVPR